MEASELCYNRIIHPLTIIIQDCFKSTIRTDDRLVLRLFSLHLRPNFVRWRIEWCSQGFSKGWRAGWTCTRRPPISIFSEYDHRKSATAKNFFRISKICGQIELGRCEGFLLQSIPTLINMVVSYKLHVL